VEAETTFVIASSSKVIVDRYGSVSKAFGAPDPELTTANNQNEEKGEQKNKKCHLQIISRGDMRFCFLSSIPD
jgi:hypothetical protein